MRTWAEECKRASQIKTGRARADEVKDGPNRNAVTDIVTGSMCSGVFGKLDQAHSGCNTFVISLPLYDEKTNESVIVSAAERMVGLSGPGHISVSVTGPWFGHLIHTIADAASQGGSPMTQLDLTGSYWFNTESVLRTLFTRANKSIAVVHLPCIDGIGAMAVRADTECALRRVVIYGPLADCQREIRLLAGTHTITMVAREP